MLFSPLFYHPLQMRWNHFILFLSAQKFQLSTIFPIQKQLKYISKAFTATFQPKKILISKKSTPQPKNSLSASPSSSFQTFTSQNLKK